MRVVLNVAEKPSIAKHLANALRGPNPLQRETSFSKYNPIYTCPGNFQNTQSEIITTSVTGHIKNLAFDVKYKNWQTTDPLILLKSAEIFSRINQDKKNIKKNLESLIKKTTDLFLWLDCDREGEAIAYEVIDICINKNRNIKIHRAKFSSADKRELLKAFKNPIKPNSNYNDAVLTRQEIDLRSGAAFTRFQTLLIRDNYSRAILGKFVSYGTCQFPTLSFIVDRYLRHVNFDPMEFWFLNLSVKKNGIRVDFNWERRKIFDEYIAKVLYVFVMEDPVVIIRKVTKKQKKRYKPYPLTTIEFQKLAVNKLRMTSAEAMKNAEKLYTSGYISYPRTETNSYKNDFGFQPILERLKNFPDFAEYISGMTFNRPRKGKKNDEAHPPIHPVKVYEKNLNTKEGKVYDLITRHFIANCSEDAIVEENDVIAEVNKEIFKAKGTCIIEKNFLKIYEKYYTLKEKKLPKFTNNETLAPHELTIKKSKTSAPNLLSESELIILMDKNGIGTDATIHEHIKTIQTRGYCLRKGKNFIPTQLGIALLVSYQDLNLNLGNPYNRAETEKNLTMIANGLKKKEEVMKKIMEDMIEAYRVLFLKKDQFMERFKIYFEKFCDLKPVRDGRGDEGFGGNGGSGGQGGQGGNGDVFIGKCEVCGRDLKIRKSKKGNYFVGCSGFPDCKNSFFFNNYNKFKKILDSEEKCGKCFLNCVKCFEGNNEKLLCKGLKSCKNSIMHFLTSPENNNNYSNNGGNNNNFNNNNYSENNYARNNNNFNSNNYSTHNYNSNNNNSNNNNSNVGFINGGELRGNYNDKKNHKPRSYKKYKKKDYKGKAKKKEYVCYKCKEVGHVVTYCPN